jgi:hypothetical protein
MCTERALWAAILAKNTRNASQTTNLKLKNISGGLYFIFEQD